MSERTGPLSDVTIVGNPTKYTQTPTGLYRRPPLHGEHTEEVLEEFNIKRKKS
ncbi:MAG: hypothetical protein OXH37_01695 [Gammaproteobacteria bacterium]|nr:hypothetical protein [Gammaproteobacteria bacterium]